MYLRKLFVFLVFSITHLFSQNQSSEVEKETWGYKITDEQVPKEIYSGVTCTSTPINITGSWKLSFDFSIYNPENYGGIFILRNEQKDYSISAIYFHYLNPDTGYLNFYINKIKTEVSIPLPKKDLNSNNWQTFTLEYIQNENSLFFYLNNKLIKTLLHTPPRNSSLNLLFADAQFDAAQFFIRDVKWFNGNILLHNWKFNEREGSVIYDAVGKNNGLAKNGEWVNSISQIFKVAWSYSAEIKQSNLTYGLDKTAGIFYVVDKTKIALYNTNLNHDSIIVTKNKIPTKQITAIQLKNNLAIFHSGAEGEVSFFDSYTQMWSPINSKGDVEQHYYASGIFVDNNKIYSIGGYGWYRWKNLIRYYDMHSRKWITLNIKTPKTFYPRGVENVEPGVTEHEWLISGLCSGGSPSGKQEDVVVNTARDAEYKDLWSFNTITNKLVKITNYTDFSKKDFVDFNFFRKDSLLYYFCIKSSDRSVVMLVSKITEPNFSEYPIFIPKLDNDDKFNYGITDVYYNKNNNKVYLLLMQWNANKYFLLSATFPPIYKKQVLSAEAPLDINNFWNNYLLIISAIVFVIIGYIAVNKIRKNNSSKEYKVFKIPNTVPQKDAIFLFGEVSILNNTGEDILKKFTSQAEQLFLLILLHTISKNKGIAGDIIDELYYGVNSTPSIANKRSVGINRLRNYLISYPEIKIETSETIFSTSLKDFSIIDLFRLQHYIDLENEELINNKDIFNDFCLILERGAFLPHLNYGWLDTFKENINEDIINKLTALVELLKTKYFKATNEHFSVIYRIASIISIHDSLNEQALKIRITHLKLKGSLGLAEKIYRNFTSEYKNTYGENYKTPFAEIIEKGGKYE